MSIYSEIFSLDTSLTKSVTQPLSVSCYDIATHPVLRYIESVRQELRNLELLASLSMNADTIFRIGIKWRIDEIFSLLELLSGTNNLLYLQVSDTHFMDREGEIFALSWIKKHHPNFLLYTLTMWRIKHIFEVNERNISRST